MNENTARIRTCGTALLAAMALIVGSFSAAGSVAADPTAAPDAGAALLLRPWSGPYGGLPPLDVATPAAIEAAFRLAIESKRAEIRVIESNPARPTFANTIEALEDSGRALQRLKVVLGIYSANMGTGDMPEVAKRLAPLQPKLDDEVAHSAALFARIDAVYAARQSSRLDPEQRRLVETVRDRFLRDGAGLAADAKTHLEAINERLAALQAKFGQNLQFDESSQLVLLEDEASLAGLSDSARAAAAAAATAKGRSGSGAVLNTRPAVWAFLQTSTRRDLREKVWRMWTNRGDTAGEHDNKPVIAEVLKLRGEKARLLGYPDFARMTTSNRMARTPETVLTLLNDVWSRVLGPTQSLLADLQKIADEQGPHVELEPWDRLFYTEALRRQRFGFDSEAVKPYFELNSILKAMFWAAGRVYQLSFRELTGIPVHHPDVRVFEVSRGGQPVGVMYFDLFRRAGKGRGSWSTGYRSAESFRGRVLPIAAVISSVEHPTGGGPALLTFDEANVWFHEFGHTLHMLSSRARYPSLDSTAVAWDFIEVPALLNERWFHDPELLRRFARHYKTGEPIPETLLAQVAASQKFERVFSLNLDYLAPAIVDMKMHLLADGRDIDAVALENQTLAELGMPRAWDEIMRVPHSAHVFSFEYAAGVYGYLWADVIAADVAESFTSSPGGLYDPAAVDRWRKELLSVGNTVPIDQAFRSFRGRDPDPRALLRRFDLDEPPARSATTATGAQH